MYDAAIIGTGPAGMSAAINLKLHNKSFVWFGPSNFSGKVEKAEKIANYPGLGLLSGGEMNAAFRRHCDEMELPITDKVVTTIMPEKGKFMLLADNEIYEAKTLLMAVGSVSPKGLDGEKELLGRGVSYCATCDGFLYKGKTIAVYCGDKRFEHEAEYLAELAEKVYFYPTYSGSTLNLPNVELLDHPIRKVQGTLRVDSIGLSDGTEISVSGLFCLRNAVAPTTLLPGLQMNGAHIEVDRDMKTSIPGCFAAGDCTGRPYQIAKAVGEGNVAAHSMLTYLTESEK